MNENIIGEIFNEFKEYGHSVINTEIFEQQINILQPRVIESCIFSDDLAKFNNDTQEIELYHWYNIFQNNPTPDDVKASEDKTHKFLSSFNISTADSKGLSYDVTISKEVDSLSKDFKADLEELLLSFQEKPDCQFHQWFKSFRNNLIDSERFKVNDKLIEIYKKYSSYFPQALEMLLSDNISASSSCIAHVLAKREDFILAQDTINTLKNHLAILIIDEKAPTTIIWDYLRILINNVVKQYKENPTYAIDLSQVVTQNNVNPQFTNKVINEFEKIFSNDADIKIFHPKVLENFEAIVNKIEDKEPVLRFIGQAVLKGLYKINLDSFERFELILAYQHPLKDLAFDVISLYLKDLFAQEGPNYAFLQSKIDAIFGFGYKLSNDLLNNVINAYEQDTKYFSDTLVRIIKLYYNNQEILANIAKTLLAIVKNKDNLPNQSIKDISFIISRLFDARVFLPDMLPNFVKFVENDDILIQKQVIELYTKLVKVSNPIADSHATSLQLQANIIKFLESNNIEQKYGFLENLLNLISINNAEKLEKFFKSLILLQNKKLLPLILDGLSKCKSHKEDKIISLSKQELEIIWASADFNLDNKTANILDQTVNELIEVFSKEEASSILIEKLYNKFPQDKEVELFDVGDCKPLEDNFIFYTIREKLLGRKDGVQDNLLYLKIEDGDLDYVKGILDVAEANDLLKDLLLDKDTNGDTALNIVFNTQNKEMAKAIFEKLFTIGDLSILKAALLVNNDYGISPLHNFVMASEEIFQEIMELASKKGALETLLIPEAGKSTTLHFAVYENLLEVVESINNLTSGVNGLQRKVLLARDSNGNTPLHWLSEGDNVGIANKLTAIDNALLKEILSVINKEGNTAFLDVILKECTEIIKAIYSKIFAIPDELLSLLAISNSAQFSPLRYMALKNEAEFKEQFKEVIDNPSIMLRLLKLKDGAGKTLRDMAAEEENAELVLFLNTQLTTKDTSSRIDAEQVLAGGEVRDAGSDVGNRCDANTGHLENDICGVEFDYDQIENYIYNNSNNLAQILNNAFLEDVIITDSDIKMIAERFLLTEQTITNKLLKDKVLEAVRFFQILLDNLELTSINSFRELLDFIKINRITQDEFEGLAHGYDYSSNARIDIAGLYKGLIKNLTPISVEYIGLNDKKAFYRSIDYLVDSLNWPADILYNLIQKTEQKDFFTLIINLEKLADYGVTADATNRRIVTALEILNNTPLEDWLSNFHSLIIDNRFFVPESRETLLLKLEELNSKTNPQILQLIKEGYFERQLSKVERVKRDWQGSRYEIVVDQPISDSSDGSLIPQGKIYIFKQAIQEDQANENEQVCLATAHKTTCLKSIDLSHDHFNSLLNIISLKDPLKFPRQDLFVLYELAVKLNIAPNLYGIYKPLDKWVKDDFSRWRQHIGKTDNKTIIDDNNIAEVLAVLSEAAHDTILSSRHAHPREVQLLSVLSLFKSLKGGLAQIATSEGKTLIDTIFIAIKVIAGIKPDIITSSILLVDRDVKEMRPFYDLFGITIKSNIRGGSGAKTFYLADIVIGDPMSFIGDAIRDIDLNVKFGRGYELLMIDEVDNMKIDQNNMKVQLASAMPGFNILRQILANMWSTATSSFTHYGLSQDENYCYYNKSTLNSDQQAAVDNLDLEAIQKDEYSYKLIPIGENCFNDFIRNFTANYTENELFAFKRDIDYRKIVIPKHLEKFSQDQLTNWLDSILASYTHQDKLDYIVYNSTIARDLIIAPVDYKNTGDIQEGLRWDNGRHPYLEVKHALTMHSETLISIFMSYYGYFLKYKDSIYGVTGTLGTKDHHDFLKKVYNVELTVIPTFIQKDFTEFKTVIVDSKLKMQEEIIGGVTRKVLGCKRAGLVIAQTIAEVKNLAKLLEQSGYDPTLIKIYGTGARGEAQIVEEKLKPGEVIFSTNAGGRGTDLRLEQEVLNAGGLIVFLTMLPASIRVQDQDFGRSARAGDPGSAILIVNTEQFGDNQCHEDLNCLIDKRNEAEIKLLNHDRLCKLPGIAMRDKLFGRSVELFKVVNSPTGYRLITGNCSEVTTTLKSLCLYQEKESLAMMLKINSPDNQHTTLNISEMINIIDPKASVHLSTILSKENSTVSSLNKQDYELTHFLAANNGFSDNPVIMARVKKSFDQAIDKELPLEYWEKVGGIRGIFVESESSEEAYLKWLVQENSDFADLKNSNQIEGTLDKALQEKVKLRKLFLLWVKDRELYNNGYEIAQMTEYFAMWLKTQTGLFDKYDECNISTPAKVLENDKLQTDLEKELGRNFDVFNTTIIKRSSIDDTADPDHLMQNPTYLILKAWRYIQIDALQKRDDSAGILEVLTSDDDNWFFFSAVKGAIKGIISTVIGVIPDFSSSQFQNYEVNNPLQDAKKFVQIALDRDNPANNSNTWISYNAMSFIRLLNDGEGINEMKQADDAARIKQQFIYDTQDAIDMIQNLVIPQLEGQLTQLLALNFIKYEDNLAIQLIGNIEIYKKIIETLYNNAEAVSVSSGKEMAQLGEFIPLEQLARNVNITQAVINASRDLKDVVGLSELTNITAAIKFNSMQESVNEVGAHGVAIFTISFRELEEEEKDWFGTIFSAILGVVQIMAGIALITVGGVFATSFGVSLISMGIGDLIGAVISVVTGNPIPIDAYINSKGISLGIAIVTAGLLHFISGIQALQQFQWIKDLSTKITVWQAVGIGAVMAATTTLASAALYNLAKPAIDRENIAEEVDNKVNSLLNDYKDLLQKIFATAIANGDKGLRKISRLLEIKMAQIIKNYNKRFSSDGLRFGVGVGSNVAGRAIGGLGTIGAMIGGAIQSGTSAALGGIKYLEAVDTMILEIGNLIRETGSSIISSGEMMKRRLELSYAALANELFAAMQQQNFVIAGEINYSNCAKFMDIELSGKLSGYNQGLVDSCNMVKKIITANYAEDLAKFGRYIKSKMTESVVNIGRQEFIKPAAETVVSAAASSEIGEQIIKAANDVKNKFTSSSNLVKDQYSNDGNAQNKEHERKPIDLEKTIRKSGVGTNQVEVEGLPWLKSKIDYDKETKTILAAVKSEDTAKVKKLIEQVRKTKNDAIVNDGTKSVKTTSNMKQLAKAVAIAKKAYIEFSKSYPLLAEHGMRVLNVGLQSLFAGAAGLANALRAESTGYIINKAAGEEISYLIEAGIDKSSKVLQKQYPELSPQEARDIAGGGMFIASLVKDGSGIATQVLRHTAKTNINLQKGLDKHVDTGDLPKKVETGAGSTTTKIVDSEIDVKLQDVLTKKKINEYLEKGGYISSEDLINDFTRIGLSLKGKSPDGKFMEFVDKLLVSSPPKHLNFI